MEARSCPAALLVGHGWKGICTVSQGGDFFLASYVTTSKLHSKTAPAPAFPNPALCLYPHWQPQRIVTAGWASTCQPDCLQEQHGWRVWAACWEHSGLLDGPGTGTDVLWAGWCPVLSVSSLQSAPSVCYSCPWSCPSTRVCSSSPSQASRWN